MDERLQRHGFDQSTYERPNRWWKCGHADEGCPCHVGPDPLGRCQASYECSPVRRGDRWTCARPERRGGSCEEGPRPDGTCACAIEPCQPELTVRAKRGVTTVATAALTLGVVLALFGGSWFEDARRSAIMPGDLSREHAAIDDCAACHEQGNAAGRAVAAGTGAATAAVGDTGSSADTAGSPHAGLDQSARCMACHESAGDRPLRPHGLSRDTLDRIARALARDTSVGDAPLPLRLAAALGPDPPRSSGEGLRCATCHREHRGRGSRLASMGELRCQSCHSVQFSSFAQGHPELGLSGSPEELPYRFDHAAHEAEHFPDEDVEFTCTGCHGGATPREGGMGERDFATMCSDCHSEEIREGALVVAQLPGIDYSVLDQQGVSVGTWPVDAGINVVTPLSPVMRAMLSADSTARRDLRLLKQVDLTYVEGLGRDTLRAAGDLAWRVKALFRDLATGGRPAMADRLARGLGVELTEAEASALASQRGPDEVRAERPGWLPAIRAARRAWLPGLEEELARRADGETPGLRVYEEYGQPTSPSEDWLIDSFDFTIRYLPGGHADVFLRELVEVSARAAATDSQAADLFTYLTSEDGPGSCGKCHRASRAGAHEGDDAWTGGGEDSDLGRLTRFDHEPHRVVACRDCHRVGPEGGIEPTRRRTCASCHDGDRASARCLNCHSYHADGFSTRSGASLLHPSPARGTPSDSAGATGDTAVSTEPGGSFDE